MSEITYREYVIIRKTALNILEDLAEMLADDGRADEDIFDCTSGKLTPNTDTFRYDCEDMIVEYIKDLLKELKR